MNQTYRHERADEELARIKQIVARHELPNFVTGFDVDLGEFNGDPAMWISFRVKSNAGLSEEDRQQQVRTLISLQRSVKDDLLDAFDERYPYFRFPDDQPTSVPAE